MSLHLPLVLAALSAPFGLPVACQKPEPPLRSSCHWQRSAPVPCQGRCPWNPLRDFIPENPWRKCIRICFGGMGPMPPAVRRNLPCVRGFFAGVPPRHSASLRNPFSRHIHAPVEGLWEAKGGAKNFPGRKAAHPGKGMGAYGGRGAFMQKTVETASNATACGWAFAHFLNLFWVLQ